MTAEQLIRRALDKGVRLQLRDGQVRYAGKPDAVAEILPELRQHKDAVMRWLKDGPASTPPPSAWRVLAQEYHHHHFRCATCIAAGQGRGLRCGTGASLWTSYHAK